MAYDDEVFIPEQVDEQVESLWDALHFVQPGQRVAPEMELIENLQRHYQLERADVRSLDTVWQRLAQQGASSQQAPQRRARPPQSGSLPPAGMRPSGPAARKRRSLPHLLIAIAAVFLLVVVIGGLVAGLVLVRQHGPAVASQPTAKPGQTVQATKTAAAPQVAYIGSDSNVWVMAWPGGTPKRLTTDAKLGSLVYGGLAWSPDGSLLAVAKGVYTNDSSMVIMKPDGTVVVDVPLPGLISNEIPFAWSPDSTMIAYRGDITAEPSLNGMRRLLLFDAHTGKVVKTFTYEVGGASGCGGGGSVSELNSAIWPAEHEGIEAPADAFTWSPDGHSLLLTRIALGSCGRGQGIQIDVSTGTTNAPYPLLGSYQPGGNLILGYWSDGTLGLTDLSANHVRALVKPQQAANPPQYLINLGFAAWASDGQSVYYEHDDSIWQIGVDASNPHQVVAGTALDSQQNATVQLVPTPLPDGQGLLYLQVSGSNRALDDMSPTPLPTPTIPLVAQWYIAHADGSNPVPLPQGISDVVWRPGK